MTASELAGLTIYFDDPPIDPRADSRGLGPVNARILEILAPATAIVNVMRLRAGQIVHRRPGTRETPVYSGLLGQAIRAAARWRLPGIAVLEAAAPPRRRWAGRAAGGALFAPLGSDIGSLRRAARLARRCGARFLPYLVDDPIETLRGAGASAGRLARAERAMARHLGEAAAVFCITAELAGRVARHAERPPIALPLPYDAAEPTERPGPALSRIIYIGSINEIYRAELRYWVEGLAKAGFFAWGELLVTSPADDLPQVTHVAFPDRAALHRAIAESAACLLPVSSRQSDLHLSSFPSKLLDYLAHGRMIFCSAPRRSVVARFFAEHDLPRLFEEEAVDFGEVEAMIRERRDCSRQYRHILDTRFSPSRFVATVAGALAGSGR